MLSFAGYGVVENQSGFLDESSCRLLRENSVSASFLVNEQSKVEKARGVPHVKNALWCRLLNVLFMEISQSSVMEDQKKFPNHFKTLGWHNSTQHFF